MTMERSERSAAAEVVPSRSRAPRTEVANSTTNAGSGLCDAFYAEVGFFSGFER